MKKAFKHLFDNFDIYITLCLAVIFAVLGLIGVVPVAILFAGILATLSSIAYSMLATRRTLDKLLQNLASFDSATAVPLKDRSAFGSFRDSLQNVGTIWLCGTTLVVMLSTHRDLFREKLQKGGELRVLIFNPLSSYLPIMAEQTGVRKGKLEVEIKTTIENCRDLVHSGLGAGKLEVNLTEKMPGYSMVICNPFGHDGQVTVEYISYKTRISERPHLELDANRDRRWFNFYVKQFEELWQSATPCPLDDPSI